MDPPARLAPPPAPSWERRCGPFILRLWPAAHPTADVEPLVALIGLAGAAALSILPLDLLQTWAGECSFRRWTGLPCATCGATRAVAALAAGEFLAAIRLNPLTTLVLLGIGLYSPLAGALWLGRWARPRITLARPAARWAAGALAALAVLAQWIFLALDGR